MAYNYANTSRSSTPVTKKSIGKKMVQNSDGGYVFNVSEMEFVKRFLITGTEKGTFYASAKDSTYKATDNLVKAIKLNGVEVVNTIVDISVGGKAHKNDHAIYALALCFAYGDLEVKQAAEKALLKVCRTGTHILQFSATIKSLRGWGKLVSRAINNWYKTKDAKSLAFQMSKYANRNGWTHLDVMRLTHPVFEGESNNVVGWLLKGKKVRAESEATKFLEAVDMAKVYNEKFKITDLIKEFGLQREHIASEYLNKVDVQKAMLPNLGVMAVIRNLSNMTKSGFIDGLNQGTKDVVKILRDADKLKKARIHPMHLMLAYKTYAAKHGVATINSALNDAFFKSFDFVESSNENYFIGVDVSPSMGGGWYSSNEKNPIPPIEVAAITAATLMKAEPWCFVGAFASKFQSFPINASSSINDVLNAVRTNSNFGGTNPSTAIEYAIKNKMDVDKFVIITDNEVNSGYHVHEKIREYRQKMNKPKAKLIVVGLEVNNFTLADPDDPYMLDIAGFTPDLVSIIQKF